MNRHALAAGWQHFSTMFPSLEWDMMAALARLQTRFKAIAVNGREKGHSQPTGQQTTPWPLVPNIEGANQQLVAYHGFRYPKELFSNKFEPQSWVDTSGYALSG
jgi:hypothetical protein